METVFMFLAGISFPLYYNAIRKGPRTILKSEEFRLYVGLIAVSAALIAANALSMGTFRTASRAIGHTLFTVVSMITTTGYTSANYAGWPTFCGMILFMLMLAGGCSGSASGGFKLRRVVIMYKLIRRGMLMRLHPSAFAELRYDGKILLPDTITQTAAFGFAYVATLFVGSIAVALNGFDFITSISAVAACLNNVGHGFGLVSPAFTFGAFSAPAELLLSFIMIVGRLELFTVFLLFSRRFWDPDRV
jgi:trk system potassium uptake protein TrkH